MLRELFSSRLFVGGLIVCVLFIAGIQFWSHHEHRKLRRDEAATRKFIQQVEAGNPVSEERHEATRPTPQEKEFAAEADDTLAAASLEGYPHGENVAEPLMADDFSGEPKTRQTSSNPLFAGGVPEHLQCPEELIGLYAKEMSAEDLRKLQVIAVEVVEKYNPNRPIAEVWPQYIASERYYHANADLERAGLGTGANRVDWGVQSILDFPEILVLEMEEPERAHDMWKVDKGDWEPDWNLHILPDGREFRTDTGYWYEFRLESGDADHYSGSVFGVGHSGRDAKRVTINLNQTSDEELKQLGGWNYNINPYTTGLYTLGGQK